MRKVKNLNRTCKLFFAIIFGGVICFDTTGSLAQNKSAILKSQIDTFDLQYATTIHGRKTTVNERIYAGFSAIEYSDLRKFIFGDSLNSVIALIKVDTNMISYIDFTNCKSGNLFTPLTTRPFIYFDKPINYKWDVNISNSLFWRKSITFIGTEIGSNGSVYVYEIYGQKGYSDFGNELVKLYFNKEIGIVKFEIKTHWFVVPVEKKK